MFAVCKGLHCAGCKPQFSLPPSLIIVILCLIYRHTIGVILETLLLGAALTFVSMAVLMAILYPIMMRILMPRTMWMSPAAVEAQNAREIATRQARQSFDQAGRNGRRAFVDVSYSVEVLPRETSQRQEAGQQHILARRYPDNAGR